MKFWMRSFHGLLGGIGCALVVLCAPAPALAQCGVSYSCGPDLGGGLGGILNPPGVCQGGACFKDAATKYKYEQDHNCRFPPAAVCSGQPMNPDTQCCGKDESTGQDKIQNRQAQADAADFRWSTYTQQCPNMKQSEGAPDALWAQCVVGQRHGASDHWPVREVVQNPGSPNARSYCIDGCSTPPGVVSSLYRAGWFIFNDKDNPTGAGPGGFGEGSSFYGACANHDKCYQTCSSTPRNTCDNNLLADMTTACNRVPADHVTTFINNFGFEDDENTRDKCLAAANRMHTGLQIGGGPAFNTRRQQYCQCC